MKPNYVSYEDFILNQNNYKTNDTCIQKHQKMYGINKIESNGILKIFEYIDFIKYQSNAGSIQSIDILKID
mgnify:CR=1 FL=1